MIGAVKYHIFIRATIFYPDPISVSILSSRHHGDTLPRPTSKTTQQGKYLLHSYPWWHHVMETLSKLLALCEGIHQSLVDSPHKGPIIWSLKFSLLLAKTLHKQSSCQWFTMTLMWHHTNVQIDPPLKCPPRHDPRSWGTAHPPAWHHEARWQQCLGLCTSDSSKGNDTKIKYSYLNLIL